MKFYKFQGAGNDFVLIDDRNNNFDETNQKLIESMCHRRFGIGADGLMLLRQHAEYDFEMIYFNSDGRTSSMCGNGGRCIVAFAKMLGVIQEKTRFIAIDGEHYAEVLADGRVKLGMNDVSKIEKEQDCFVLDTGSPHYVSFVDNAEKVDILPSAHAIRYNDQYKSSGINVNFASKIDKDTLRLRTYERGVEDETWACGTGATAVAIAAYKGGLIESNSINLQVNGGELCVEFEVKDEKFETVYLIGPAEFVYEGDWPYGE